MTGAILLPIAVKGALVLAIAFLALRLLRGVPAAVRHGIWTAAFAALLVLPALDAFGPSWGLPILPDEVRMTEATSSIVGERISGGVVVQMPPAPPAVPSPGATTRTIVRSGPHATVERTVTVLPAVPRPPSPAFPLGTVLLGLWGLGVAVLLLRWVAAYVSAATVVRAATPVDDDEWLVLAERARRLVGVRDDVRLVQSDALTVPVAWGLGAPAVVLPADADAWGESRREAVLLHEMAHLRRADARTQLVAQLAVALHWPNPLAWLAYRRFLTEREHACDDAVLSGGAAPSAYAGHLVEIARRARRREPLSLSAVSPMARRSDLEGRVLSVLDAGRRRVAAGRSPLAQTVALGLLVAVPLGTVHAVASTPERSLTVHDRRTPAVAGDAWPRAEASVGEAAPETVAADLAADAVEAAVADALLDTIPRAETVLGPALDAALADVRQMRAGGLGLTDDAWDEIEAGVREAFEDAYLDYDEAVAEARAEAEMERREGDAEWRADLREALAEAEADRQEAIAEMAQATAERTLNWGQGGDARRAADRRTRAAQEAYRAAEHAQRARETALRDADRARQQALRNAAEAQRIGLQQAERERERVQRSVNRSRHTTSSSSSGYAYSVSEGGRTTAVTTSPGVGVWMTQLSALDQAATGIDQAIAEIRARGNAPPGALAGLRGGLAGLEGGLAGVAASAQSWARSDAEREIARTRLDVTRRRLRDA